LGPWFDRGLSLAGRCWCRGKDQEITYHLVDFKRPLLFIPSLAIHLNREANSGVAINQQSHLPPLVGQILGGENKEFHQIVLDELGQQGQKEIELLGFDLFCYDPNPPEFSGLANEFIIAPRLDNLLSCHAGLHAMISGDRKRNTLLYCANHEEIGSLSVAGAKGNFLNMVFDRLCPTEELRSIMLGNSFLISVDNAHATHPNHLEKMDKEHEIHLNTGPVIKVNANYRYTSTSLSSAIFKEICRKTKVSPQEFVMRSDQPCGSTIGPTLSAALGIQAVDIGAPTLGMHSIREITGTEDPFLLFSALRSFIQSSPHKAFFSSSP
jgi:aspartyl aminopeptidase